MMLTKQHRRSVEQGTNAENSTGFSSQRQETLLSGDSNHEFYIAFKGISQCDE